MVVRVQPTEEHVLRQREWTREELERCGFNYYAPNKRVVMARILKQNTSIESTLEILMAESGDIICYDSGDELHEQLDDYYHWPVKRDLFRRTYKRWDELGWKPNPTQAHLIGFGCLPFFKWRGIWALRLPIAIYVQSLESPEPVVVPSGRWLCIGIEGEPYNMNDEQFQARYVPAEPPSE